MEDVQTQQVKNIKRIIGNYWKWFTISIVIFILLGFLYVRYSTPLFKVTATILVQDDKKNSDLPNADLLDQLGLGGKSNVDNEVEILKSRTLIEKVVDELGLYVEYYREGRVKNMETYKKGPIFFDALKVYNDSVKIENRYYLNKLADSVFALLNDDGAALQQIKIGDVISIPEGVFKVLSDKSLLDDSSGRIQIRIRKRENVVEDIMNSMNISIPNKQVTTIQISLPTNIPAKGEDIINKLIDVYLRSSVEDKNRIADSTMKFIDDRVSIIGKELGDIDKDIQGFKEKNKLTDLTAQSQALIQNSSYSAQQLTQQQVQMLVVESLQNYLNDNANNKKVVPVSLIVQDPGFIELLTGYNGLQLEREKVLLSSTENNPAVINIDNQLDRLRASMIKSLIAIHKGLETAVEELKRQTSLYALETTKVPEKERLYLEKSRMQTVKQQLFLFLLQKREETAISKSSTLANARIIDAAKSENKPFQPKKALILLASIIMGLLVPSIFIFTISFFDTTIKTKEDIKSRVNVPIVGEISHYNGKELLPVYKENRTMLSEQFRMLRTNLQYVLAGVSNPVILFTSSMSSEGKSFVSLNLAFTTALSGRKTLYIELDMRKPRLAQTLGLPTDRGFSTLAIEQHSINDLIFQTKYHENLFLLPSGPMPPNPAELLMLPSTSKILSELKNQFDYIIIDTPPVGLVTDSLLLTDYFDSLIFMVRHKKTYKEQIIEFKDLLNNHSVPRPVIVLNDISIKSGYAYGYGYGGKSEYYARSSEKKSFFNTWIKRLKA